MTNDDAADIANVATEALLDKRHAGQVYELTGRNSALTDGVQRALGRVPRDFAGYAAKTAASGVWSTR